MDTMQLINPHWKKASGIWCAICFCRHVQQCVNSDLSQVLPTIGVSGPVLFQTMWPTYLIVVGGNAGTPSLIQGKDHLCIENNASNIALGNGAQAGEPPRRSTQG